MNKFSIDDLLNCQAIKDIANKESFIKLCNSKEYKTVYCGFDPTGDSLHLGHYIQFITLKKLHLLGFTPIVLIGEGTALIGDPSGKNKERQIQSEENINDNAKKITIAAKKILDECLFLNNKTWLIEQKLIYALRDYGKYFNISAMIKKQNIASRLEVGISFTEFTYVLLQSIDFLTLYKNNNTYGQIGGSDQWGNIVSGIELISKLIPKSKNNIIPFGLTFELLTDDSGKKFGKTESNSNIWLNEEKTSPYELYQFLYNQPDSIIEKLFHYFTIYTLPKINNIISKHSASPKKRYAQTLLANQVIVNIYGEKTLSNIELITKALFENKIDALSKDNFLTLIRTITIHKIPKKAFRLLEVFKDASIITNSKELNTVIENKSLKINNVILEKIDNDIFQKIQPLHKKFFFVKKGKKKFYIFSI